MIDHLVAGARVDAGEVEARVLERDREHPAPSPADQDLARRDAEEPVRRAHGDHAEPDRPARRDRRLGREVVALDVAHLAEPRRELHERRPKPEIASGQIRRIRRIEPEQERPDVDAVEGHAVEEPDRAARDGDPERDVDGGGRQLVQHAGEPLELPLDVATDLVGRAGRHVEVGIDAGELERLVVVDRSDEGDRVRRLDAEPRQADVDLDHAAHGPSRRSRAPAGPRHRPP